VELNIVTDEGLASAMSLDKGLRIGGRGALDEFEGSDKQGEFDCIIEIELGFYKLNLKVSSAGSSQPLT
jgi:hypothetical protein